MSIIRKPSYYKDFKCIADKCTDSCCEKWEIDIDEDTLEFYKSVEGEFGERLRKNICFSECDDEPSHFIQTQDERCPFLNECNLCDIFLNLGEEKLSQICTHHPRFYEWFTNITEAGLGMCCEEAARLILTENVNNHSRRFVEETEDESSENDKFEDGISEDDEMDYKELEDLLFEIRAELFEIIDGRDNIIGVQDKIYAEIPKMQSRYDDYLFGECMKEDKDGESMVYNVENKSWQDYFFNKNLILKLLDFYQGLEINDMEWWEKLEVIKENVDEILASKDDFLRFYSDRLYEYRNLMVYFIYRHFMKIRFDDMLREKIMFCLLSVSTIEILDIWEWINKGDLSLKGQIDICKLFSKEIEYDEENTEKLSLFDV